MAEVGINPCQWRLGMGGDAKVKVVVTMVSTLGVVESEIVALAC